MEIRTYVTMDDNELDDLVAKAYENRNYSFVASEEMSNDSEKEVTGICITDDESDIEEIDEVEQKLINGECPSWNTHYVLMALRRKQLIPDGDYLIKCSW